MKTRRILAASTAALLAFGTTAAYVSASGAAAATTISGVSVGTHAVESTTNYTKLSGFMTDFPYTATISGTTITVNFATKTEAEVKAWDNTRVEGLNTIDTELRPIVLTLEGISPTDVTKLDGTATDSSGWGAADGANTKVFLSSKTPRESFEVGNTTTYTIAFTYKAATTTSTPEEDDGPVYTDLTTIDEEDYVNISDDIAIKIATKEGVTKLEDEKYENYKITASNITGVVPSDQTDKDGNRLVETGDDGTPAIKGLNKTLKSEFKKLKASEVKVFEIKVGDGSALKNSTPVPVTIKLTTSWKPNIYHKNGENLEALKIDAVEQLDGTWESTFTTKNFSPFVITKTALKNAKATTKDNEPTSATVAETSDGTATTNPDTGIALAIAPVVLAAGAVAVVALKKKH